MVVIPDYVSHLNLKLLKVIKKFPFKIQVLLILIDIKKSTTNHPCFIVLVNSSELYRKAGQINSPLEELFTKLKRTNGIDTFSFYDSIESKA